VNNFSLIYNIYNCCYISEINNTIDIIKASLRKANDSHMKWKREDLDSRVLSEKWMTVLSGIRNADD